MYILTTLLNYYLKDDIRSLQEIKNKTSYGKWLIEDYIINYLNEINP